MNRKALRSYFENNLDESIEWKEVEAGFLLYTEELSNETLSEVAACNGAVQRRQNDTEYLIHEQ